MREVHDKLVRDRIPEIISAAGGEYEIETLGDDEFPAALRAKLIEEAREAAAASPAELTSELADLYEVMDALIEVCGISKESVLAEQRRRRAERGAFARRIRLLWSTSP